MSINANIHCPNHDCRKPILSRVALAESSTFVMKCPNCGHFVKVIAGFNLIQKRLLSNIKDNGIISPFTADY